MGRGLGQRRCPCKLAKGTSSRPLSKVQELHLSVRLAVMSWRCCRAAALLARQCGARALQSLRVGATRSATGPRHRPQAFPLSLPRRAARPGPTQRGEGPDRAALRSGTPRARPRGPRMAAPNWGREVESKSPEMCRARPVPRGATQCSRRKQKTVPFNLLIPAWPQSPRRGAVLQQLQRSKAKTPGPPSSALQRPDPAQPHDHTAAPRRIRSIIVRPGQALGINNIVRDNSSARAKTKMLPWYFYDTTKKALLQRRSHGSTVC